MLTNLEAYAKETAARNLRDPDLETVLRRWWVKKYKLPWTHRLAQEATYPDLLVEFYEDLYEERPQDARKALSKNGEFFFEGTGDPFIDKWEKELAAGLTPDLSEAYTPEHRKKWQKEKEALANAKVSEVPPEFEDNYTNSSTSDPRLASKFVARGGKEEAELLARRQARMPIPVALKDKLLGRG